MTGLDQEIIDVLREHAEAPVDTVALTAGAVTRGRSLRRRRRAGLAAGAAAVAAVAVAGTAALLPAADHGRAGPAASAPTPAVSLPALPAAPGVPGLAQAPAAVGTDVGVVHFRADGLTAHAGGASWSVSHGLEQVDIGGRYDVWMGSLSVARSTAAFAAETKHGPLGAATAATVAGHPATVESGTAPGEKGRRFYRVDWRPAAGVVARATTYAASPAAATAFASGLQPDRAGRLVGPFRLTALPAGMSPQRRSVRLTSTGPETSPFFFEDLAGGGKQAHLSASAADIALEPGGQQRAVAANGLVVTFDGQQQGLTTADRSTLMHGIAIARDPKAPLTW